MFQVPYILLPCASCSLIYFPCKQGFHIPHLHNTSISCSSPPLPTSFTYSHHTAHVATWAFHVREPLACFLHMNSMSQVWAPRGGGYLALHICFPCTFVSDSIFYMVLPCKSPLSCPGTYYLHVHAAAGRRLGDGCWCLRSFTYVLHVKFVSESIFYILLPCNSLLSSPRT